MKKLGIYVHIPFCYKKCNYCDFNSIVCDEGYKKLYVKSLINEIQSTKCNDFVDSVFIGGGTPTSIEIDDLCAIIESIYNTFNCVNPEFTVEVNPKTADYNDFVMLKKYGVNRLSFGVQSSNDDELQMLGRIHTFNDFIHSYNECIKAGFDNINTDIMFSLPDQNIEKLNNTINNIISLKPQHISCYSLIVEKNTPFYTMDLKLPTETEEKKMYDYICETLDKNNYLQYEISNFSLDGYECIHNIGYWERDDYLGFGAGAASLYGNKRYSNTYSINEYIKANERNIEELSENDMLSEYVFLGLRMNKGFNIDKINRKFNIDFLKLHEKSIEKYINLNLMEYDGKNLRLTHEGFYVSNEIMCSLI